MMRNPVVPYQFSIRTTKPAEVVLEDVATRGLVGISVVERGPSYIVLRKRPRYRYSGDIAVAAGIGILLVALVLTAITPVFIVLLPCALLPAVPFYLDRRPMLAVSAIDDDEPGTARVTVHGQATPELAAALDAYLATLPAAPAVVMRELAGVAG